MLDSMNDIIGAKKVIILASFCGALVSLRYVLRGGWYRTALGVVEALYVLTCGGVMSVFVSPAFSRWLAVGDEGQLAVAFGVGLFGVSISGELWKHMTPLSTWLIKKFLPDFKGRHDDT